MKNKQLGFSIIEILVVLLLVSILGSILIPTFMGKKKGEVKKQFVAQFTTLVQNALYQAINLEKIHQAYFDFDHYEIMIKVHDDQNQEQDKHKQFAPAAVDELMSIPESFVFHNFFIGQNDEIETGNITHDAWFYIMPDGTSQPIIINIENGEVDQVESDKFSLTVNPFYSQVREYESFQQP